MGTLVGRRNPSSAICFLLQTYLISTWAFAAKTASKGPHVLALCLPTAPRHGFCSSGIRQSSAVASSTRRKQHPTATPLALTLLRGPVLFERTRIATAEHTQSSSRCAAVRLGGSASDSTGGPAAVSIPTIAAVTETSASLDAAEPASPSSPASAAPPLLSIKWARGQMQRLRQHVFELPEDTAEEGRFLMMAALVGVITGTAGEWGFSTCACLFVCS